MPSVLFFIVLCLVLVTINGNLNEGHIIKLNTREVVSGVADDAFIKYRIETSLFDYDHFERVATTDQEMLVYQYETASNKIPLVYFKKNTIRKGDRMLLAFVNQSDLTLSEESDDTTIKAWRSNPKCDETTSDIGMVSRCVDSKESMVNFVHATMKTHNVKLITTPAGTLGMYEVIGKLKPIPGELIACHKQTFNTTNAVYLCHYLPNSSVEVVPLMRLNDREQINAIAICHLNTTSWNANGFVLRLLKMKPGPPVCHYLTTDGMIWLK